VVVLQLTPKLTRLPEPVQTEAINEKTPNYGGNSEHGTVSLTRLNRFVPLEGSSFSVKHSAPRDQGNHQTTTDHSVGIGPLKTPLHYLCSSKMSQDEQTNPAEKTEPSHVAQKVNEDAVQDVLELSTNFSKEFSMAHLAVSGNPTAIEKA
jgi:hypothetical protein